MRKTSLDDTQEPQAPTATRSSLFVGSTEKAFQVLHAFAGSKRHRTLADIARESGLDRSAQAKREIAAFDDQYVRAQTGFGAAAASNH